MGGALADTQDFPRAQTLKLASLMYLCRHDHGACHLLSFLDLGSLRLCTIHCAALSCGMGLLPADTQVLLSSVVSPSYRVD